MKMLVLLEVVLLASFLNGQEASIVPMKTEPTRVYLEESDSVILTCDLNPDGKPLRWNHNSELIAVISEGDNIHFINAARDNGTYQLQVPSTAGGNYTMRISTFLPNHAGDVMCSVSETPPLQARLQLIKPPDSVHIVETDSGAVVPLNSDTYRHRTTVDEWVNLTCLSVNSKPQPIVQWWWNSTNLINDWNFLISRISTVTGAFNGSSMLYLPPGFSSILIDSLQIFNVTTQSNAAMSVADTSVTSNLTLGNLTNVSNYSTLAPPVVNDVIEITCSTMVGDREYVRSVVVHVRNEWNKGLNPKSSQWTIFGFLAASYWIIVLT
uniref:Uncharacterized protein LOC100185792 n=1 Tax=Phallusia mammillata TaxID=59560 RepID=A0A6F9DHM4_9ASCI|nr:uncharacterized protein LOC100185792 [Phallusia mammillata]